MAEAGWAVENLREALLCRPSLPPGGRHGGGRGGGGGHNPREKW